MRREARWQPLLVLCVGCVGCGALGPELGARGAAITDGEEHSGHPAVGVLRGGRGFCTATLVGTRTVLTAAHCVLPGNQHTFEAEGQSYVSRAKEGVVVHPQWQPDPTKLSLHDIALVLLETAPQVEPRAINREPTAVAEGLPLTLVGYGRAGTDIPGLGTKRIATNTVDRVEATRFRFSGTGGGQGSTCHGDSGGPALATIDGQEVIVGITSTASETCGDYTWDTRTDAYLDWLASHAADLAGKPRPPDAGLGAASESGGCSVAEGRSLASGLLALLALLTLLTLRYSGMSSSTTRRPCHSFSRARHTPSSRSRYT